MARQNFIGLVVSQGKMQKTVKVRVETKVFNKSINKELLSRKDYLVHDEGETAREGDLVRIEATRPLSKRKFFAIAEILRNKGQQFALYESQAKENVLREESIKTQQFFDRRRKLEAKAQSESSLLADIKQIQNALKQGQNVEELTEIKEKYGITEFSPHSLRLLLQLNVNLMQNEVEQQRDVIDKAYDKIDTLMHDPESANKLLLQNGVKDPEKLKTNIKKNIIRKYVLKELKENSL